MNKGRGERKKYAGFSGIYEIVKIVRSSALYWFSFGREFNDRERERDSRRTEMNEGEGGGTHAIRARAHALSEQQVASGKRKGMAGEGQREAVDDPNKCHCNHELDGPSSLKGDELPNLKVFTAE